MNSFITILFLFTHLLFSSPLQNFSVAFASIEKEERNFLDTMLKEKNTSSSYKKTSAVRKQKTITKQKIIIKKEILEKKVLLKKSVIFLEEQKYLTLQKALKKIEVERRKRKVLLYQLKEDIFKNNVNKAQVKPKKYYEEVLRKKQKRLAYIHKQKIFLKMKEEKVKQALIKKALAKKKLHEKKLYNSQKKGYIIAEVDISQQRMKVYKNNKLLYTWKVSTARRGHKTPTGNFKAQIVKKMHYSSLYNNSPMPYTIFYDGNYAIHGTSQTRKLGRVASHGCVRLHTNNAKKLYKLARKYGRENVSVKIVR